MWPFNKHEDEDSDDALPGEGKTPESGEGKFPPAEQAFDQPQTPEMPNIEHREPDPEFDAAARDPLHSTAVSQTPKPQEEMPSFTGPQVNPEIPARLEQDRIEILLAKVDAIKAIVETINHRMDSLEGKKNDKVF